MKSLRWMDSALCAQTDPAIFFPEKRGQNITQARRICGQCPVRTECGDHAQYLEGDVSSPLRHGAWAGMSALQRAEQGGTSQIAIRDEQIIRLTEHNLTPSEIAPIVGCNIRTVARVRKAHRQQEATA